MLERGFALVHQRNGKPLRSIHQAQSGDELVVHLADGRISSVVKQVESDGHG